MARTYLALRVRHERSFPFIKGPFGKREKHTFLNLMIPHSGIFKFLRNGVRWSFESFIYHLNHYFLTLRLIVKFWTQDAKCVTERFLQGRKRLLLSIFIRVKFSDHHNFFNSSMEQSCKVKQSTVWTDANRKALREALELHSNGRYSNLANAKGKWKLVVADFLAKTG